MFITVMFGAGCRELVNPWCNLVTLSAHLRRRGGVPPDAPIALLAEDGNLVSLDEGLEEGASPAACMGGSLLQERGTYVLVHIIKGEGMAPTRYESLLENLDAYSPELAGGLPGPSRRAALAVRPPSHGQQLQEAHEHSAWPPGARPPFEASEGGLPAIQDPLAGARSQARANPMTWDTAAKWPSWTHTQRGFAVISALCDLAQTDGSRAGFHLQNLE